MYNGGWIKIFRKFEDWGWFTVPKTAHLFIYCLLKANITDKMWHGQLIARGSFITSRASLSVGTGLTEQEVRTALGHLTSTGEIQCTSTNLYTHIIVCNYDNYQDIASIDQPTEQPANQPTTQPTEQPANQPQHKNREIRRKNNNTSANADVSEQSPDVADGIDYAGLVRYWNETTQGRYGELKSIENNRRKLTRARIKQYGKQTFSEAIKKVAAAVWLEDKTWFNYDWLIRPNNFDKVISGNYDERTAAGQPTTANITYITKDANGTSILCYNDANGNPVIIPWDAPQRPNANCDWDNNNRQWINRH